MGRRKKKDSELKDYLISLGIIGWFTFGEDMKEHFKKKGVTEEQLEKIAEQCKKCAKLIKRVKEVL